MAVHNGPNLTGGESPLMQLLQKLETLRLEGHLPPPHRQPQQQEETCNPSCGVAGIAAFGGTDKRKTMKEELRSLQFWRAIIAECLATFFYVFFICGAYIPWPGYGSLISTDYLHPLAVHGPTSARHLSESNVQGPGPISHHSHTLPAAPQLLVSFVSGLAMATLVHGFGHISGGHVNPAVTIAMLVVQKVSPLRALMYVTAQCGGAIAGAALLYGVTITGYQGALGVTSVHTALSSWQGFGIEFLLCFVVSFTVFATVDPQRRSPASAAPALLIGVAYLVCSLASFPGTGASLNPARTLGPAFVMNRWSYHWVYWFGPIGGAILAGLIYEYIFDPKKGQVSLKEVLDELERAESSVPCNEEDYEEADTKAPKYSTVNTTGNHHHGGYTGIAPNLHRAASSVSAYAAAHYDNYHQAATLGPSSSSIAAGFPTGYALQPQNTAQSGIVSSTYAVLPANNLNAYRTLHANSTAANTYAGTGSLYESSVYRPHSAVSAYATIHGNRPGGGITTNALNRAPQRMEYGPGTTKF